MNLSSTRDESTRPEQPSLVLGESSNHKTLERTLEEERISGETSELADTTHGNHRAEVVHQEAADSDEKMVLVMCEKPKSS